MAHKAAQTTSQTVEVASQTMDVSFTPQVMTSDLPLPLVGQVPFEPLPSAGDPDSGVPPNKSLQVPSLLWKAYTIAVKNQFAVATDLSASDQAIFMAGPRQAGIPGGPLVSQNIVNYQIYTKCDGLQEINHPFYQSDVESFFGYADSFLDNVKYAFDSKNPQPSNARAKLEEAKAAIPAAWNGARDEYVNANDGAKGPTTFASWVMSHQNPYTAARTQVKVAEADLLQRLTPEQSEVVDAIAAMSTANDRVNYHPNSNMPCVATDSMFTGSARLPNATDQFFLPTYTLTNYIDTVGYWIRSFNSGTYVEYPLDFILAQTTKWATLGHPDLDKVPPPESHAAIELYKTITGSIRFSAMRTFDVGRGQWNPQPSFRSLGKLWTGAPERLRHRIQRPTELLVGYAVDLVVTLPMTVTSAGGQAAINMLGMPVTSTNGNELHLTVADNAYPVLLGVLTSST